MEPLSEKIKQWIDEGKDPRSAHWQAGLESVMNVFDTYLEPGKLIPVQPLEEKDIPVFQEALEVIDLSPNLQAAFLPPPVANKITPPESAEELQRIDPDKPSYKILIVRSEKELRLLCIEISPHAKKFGADIFQAGALLGTYDYTDRQECLQSLNKVLRAHIWEKEKWGPEDHKRYTVNWFERVMDLHKGTIAVDTDRSFFHTPTLIKSNRIDAIFMLIFETFRKQAENPDEPFKEKISAIQAIADTNQQTAQCNEMAEKAVFQLLNVIKDCELVNFDSFTDKENKQFKQEFDRTVRRIVNRLKPVYQELVTTKTLKDSRKENDAKK